MIRHAITLRFFPDFANVDLARAAIQGICRELFGFANGTPFTTELCLAATEAMNNVVEHSGTRAVELELTAGNNGVTLRLTTGGLRFDPTVPSFIPDDSICPLGAESGYGLALVQKLVDRMEYSFRDGKNILVLYKDVVEREENGHGDQT